LFAPKDKESQDTPMSKPTEIEAMLIERACERQIGRAHV